MHLDAATLICAKTQWFNVLLFCIITVNVTITS